MSRSRRLRLITESNKQTVLYTLNEKNGSRVFRKQHNAYEFGMITRDLECPRHDVCIMCSYDTDADFEN